MSEETAATQATQETTDQEKVTQRYSPTNKAIVVATQHAPMLPKLMHWLAHYSGKYTKTQVFFEGTPKSKVFKNGEFLAHMGESVRQAEVFVFAQPRYTDEYLHKDIFEVCQLLRSAKSGNASIVHLVIPSIPYTRQDRITLEREFPSFRLLIDLLGSAGADTITTFEIHNDATVGYAAYGMENLSTMNLVAKTIKEKILDVYGNNVSLGSADVGNAKFVERLSEFIYNKYDGIELNSVIIEKKRNLKSGETTIKGLMGKPQETVILVDDMMDTGGTAKKGSLYLKECGVKRTFMVATHPIFGKGAAKNIAEAGFEKIFTTDSCWSPDHPEKVENLELIPMAKMIAGVMDNIHNKKSVTNYVNGF